MNNKIIILHFSDDYFGHTVRVSVDKILLLPGLTANISIKNPSESFIERVPNIILLKAKKKN